MSLGGDGAPEEEEQQQQQQQQQQPSSLTSTSLLLCASCDYCRSRKTKCDGQRPCSNCLTKYLKKHNLTSAEGIDAETMECMYSPAKRRGPTPGIRSSAAATHSLILQQQQQSDIHAMTAAATAGSSDASTKSSTPTPTPSNPTQNTQNQAHTHPIYHPQSNSLSIHNNNTINSNSNSAALSNHGQQQQQQRQLHQQQQQQYPPAQQSMDPSMLMQHQQLHNAYYGQSTAEWSNTLHPFSQQQQQQQVALPHQQQHGQPVDTMDSLLLQQHQYQQNNNNNNLSQGGNTNFLGSSSVGNNSALNHHQQQQHSPLLQATSIGGGNRNSNNNNNAMMQTQLNQLTLLQQKIQQQHQQQQQQQQFQHFNLLNTMDTAPTSSSLAMAAASVTTLDPLSQQRNIEPMTFLSNQPNLVATPNPVADVAAATAAPFATLGAVGLPRTIMAHTHLIDRGDAEGSRLWAYYKLSVDEIFRLPSTPTDEEYCTVTGRPLVGSPLAALSAARFAESALGALAHNEIGLGMELCNAVVHCLKESLQDPLDFSVVFEVAKAYFLLGIGRAFRGDLVRYFKYRRVCLSYLSKLGLGDDRAHSLIASMAYLDSWAYMMYNGCEKEIPNVDHATANLPRNITTERGSVFSSIEAKYGVKLDIYSIISDPNNKIWMQGAPAIFLNKDAPLQGRALDAIACAVRTSCDQANNRFATLVKENGTCAVDKKLFFQLEDDTPTSSAVLANENELCNRSIVASAHMLIKQHDASKQGNEKNEGLYLAISALDAFLEIDDGDLEGGFTDSQIQSLLSVCHSTVENPLILYHAGPTYHIVTNATIMLCHFLNSMHAMRSTTQFGPMEATLFEEVVDTVVAVRKLLTVHRRKLPVKLRCHGIPRPTLEGIQDGQPFIDLGETQLCPCRSCQGFVLLACSPSVAAERVRSAASRLDVAIAQEAEAVDLGELSSIGGNAGGSNDSGGGAEENADFDLDDDALISLLGRLIAN